MNELFRQLLVSLYINLTRVNWILVFGSSAAYLCVYLHFISRKPQLITGSATLSRFLYRYCPVVAETYYPTFWCWEARVQTLLRPFIAARPWVKYRNELIQTADGGHVSLDWNDNENNDLYPVSATRPTILILPGLTGTSKESYMLCMVKQSEILGYRCVVFNNRGVAGERLLTPRTYCAANTEDLETVISHVQNTFPQAPLMAAGVSMGGHRQILDKLFNIDYIMKAKTIREFDERFTSVMFGYKTNADYYRDASPYHKLKSIEVPVLCLNALDDVFSPADAIPMQSAKENPNVALLLTVHGGHIGFLEGIFPRQITYMDRIFKQFIQAVFEHEDELKST
ncbi:phospholipase ABHD3 isoform X4 [Narcine bancroftii]|uniref:phospholipase ABHD3 isoform X4 n=1 Tax=Narcine bancroftii TaxID=1343680 RepID=UPI0038322EC8